jgi:hypothetical protein
MEQGHGESEQSATIGTGVDDVLDESYSLKYRNRLATHTHTHTSTNMIVTFCLILMSDGTKPSIGATLC